MQAVLKQYHPYAVRYIHCIPRSVKRDVKQYHIKNCGRLAGTVYYHYRAKRRKLEEIAVHGDVPDEDLLCKQCKGNVNYPLTSIEMFQLSKPIPLYQLKIFNCSHCNTPLYEHLTATKDYCYCWWDVPYFFTSLRKPKKRKLI